MTDARPLRILAITSRPLISAGGEPIALLDVDEERRRLRTALRQANTAVELRFLPQATVSTVMTALRSEWDIVHFTGHGTPDGFLVLENDYGVAHVLSQQEMASLFDGGNVPLVVLSACHSETTGRAITAAGVPNVIAVDAAVPIADVAAIVFAEHLYNALAHNRSIADAFADAQKAVALHASVGDSHPPKDKAGVAQKPWSQRFRPIGNGGVKFATTATGGYQETGPQQPAHNLPTRGDFVGRAQEISNVVHAFRTDARVALVGSGGLGKTALSLAVARWFAERGLMEAIVWASASGDEGEYKLRDLASLIDIAGRALRLPFNEQTPTEERKRIVRDTLAQHSSLLVLDNWETLTPEAKKELWTFVLSLPDTARILVTSRLELPARQSRNIHLDPLREKDAVSLFVNVAHNAGYFEQNPKLSDGDMDLLLQICAHLSGYPLAVEVVAGQTATRTLTDIWNDLRTTPQLVLETIDELTGEPRGVWTSLDLSYNILPEQEKRLFRRMCVFLAPATAEDIAAVTEDAQSRKALDTLVRSSLVRMHEGSYSLLPVIKQYAESKLTDSGEEIVQRHLIAFTFFGEKETLDASLLASDHLFELINRYKNYDVADTFDNYVRSFIQQLIRQGFWTEARVKLMQSLKVFRLVENRIGESQVLGELGNLAMRQGDYALATKCVQESFTNYLKLGDKNGIAQTQHQLGNIAYFQGDYDLARMQYAKSLEATQELGNKSGIAIAQHQLGMLAQDQGDLASAAQWYEKSLKLKQELGDISGIANTQGQLGNLALLKGDYICAAEWYTKVMITFQESGDKSGIAITQHQLGMLAQDQGDLASAAQWYEKSLKLKQKLGDINGIGLTLGQLGSMAFAQADFRTALAWSVEAFRMFDQLGSPYHNATLGLITDIRNAVGDEQFQEWCRELGIKIEVEE